MSHPHLPFALHLDPFASATAPHGLTDGWNVNKRGAARDMARFYLSVVQRLRAPAIYLDIGKAFVPPQRRSEFHGDGLLRMKKAGVPFALEFEAAFRPLMEAIPTLVYIGWMPQGWEPVYDLFPAARWVAQDYTGTATGKDIDGLLRANERIPTLVEGPANDDRLLPLGCVVPTSSWWMFDRAQQHQGARFALCNAYDRPDFIDLEWDSSRFDFEGRDRKVPWGQHWVQQCWNGGVTPCFGAFSGNGFIDVGAVIPPTAATGGGPTAMATAAAGMGVRPG